MATEPRLQDSDTLAEDLRGLMIKAAAYDRRYAQADEGTARAWLEALGKFSKNTCLEAVAIAGRKNPFLTVAHVYETAETIHRRKLAFQQDQRTFAEAARQNDPATAEQRRGVAELISGVGAMPVTDEPQGPDHIPTDHPATVAASYDGRPVTTDELAAWRKYRLPRDLAAEAIFRWYSGPKTRDRRCTPLDISLLVDQIVGERIREKHAEEQLDVADDELRRAGAMPRQPTGAVASPQAIREILVAEQYLRRQSNLHTIDQRDRVAAERRAAFTRLIE